MPLAKTSHPQQVTKSPEHTTSTPISDGKYNGVPFELYTMFDVTLATDDKTRDKLLEIYTWSTKDSETLGDALLKIRRLEGELGAPSVNEKGYDKLWRWVKLQRHIDSMQKEQESMRKRWL